MKLNFLVITTLALFLSACDQSSSNPDVLASAKRNTGSCEVTAATLTGARNEFQAACGYKPRDCDPTRRGWVCSSNVIGASAPALSSSGQSTSTSHSSSASQACSASGKTLAAARSNFAGQCAATPRDCDPIAGSWMCSSEVIGSNAPPRASASLDDTLKRYLRAASGGAGTRAFQLPDSDDLAAIPQDPNNPLSDEKVALGMMLYHDTAFALEGRGGESESWSCATCHHAAAGFKSGVRQGVANGGVGFGQNGESRVVALGFDATAEKDSDLLPDLQPLASPTILNSAYQAVMLWNGQFGNGDDSAINTAIPKARLITPDTPKEANAFGLSGLETQAIAGTGVHRLRFSEDSPLQNQTQYIDMFAQAYPAGSDDYLLDAAKAIAAYERTVLANKSPFQYWLRGDDAAMSQSEKRGAILFFGKAGCADCHTGPALSSAVNATESELFMAIGFADFDTELSDVHGAVDTATAQGRGGFTGEESDQYAFKVTPLYNLADSRFFGHGSSFTSIREVLEYKNNGVAQADIPGKYLDTRFVPLQLSASQLDDLESFLATGLYDPDLVRYQPESVPSGRCVIVDDASVSFLCN